MNNNGHQSSCKVIRNVKIEDVAAELSNLFDKILDSNTVSFMFGNDYVAISRCGDIKAIDKERRT